MKIAIASYINTGRYKAVVPDEDVMLVELFENNKHIVDVKVWDDPNVDWKAYDVVVIKSTWDYFIEKIDAFKNWLKFLKDNNIKCLNAPETILWNADKHYLLDVEKAGLKIVPTIIFEKNTEINLDTAFEKFNCSEIVVKPCVSGGAMNTVRVQKNYNQDDVNQINYWLKHDSYLIQPFKSEILTEGEWSFIYFNGKFSHHVLKTGKENEFRIQHFFGGSINTPKFNKEMLEQSYAYIDKFAKNCLYARVDGVWTNSGFELMELELIEPYLFFFTNNNSLNNYYQAFKELTT